MSTIVLTNKFDLSIFRDDHGPEFSIFVGDLGPEVNEWMLLVCNREEIEK